MPGDPLDRAKEALLWARAQRLSIARITVGDVTIELAGDLAQSATDVALAAPADVGNLYRTFGGVAVSDAMTIANRVANDDDDEPAIVEERRR